MSKKGFFLSLILSIVSIVAFSSCVKDEVNSGIQITKSMVVGTWNVTSAIQNGNTVSVPSGMIQITLKQNDTYSVQFFTNRYVGTYTINGNSVIGKTLDPITEYYRFEKLNGSNATISYSNSQGEKYIFFAVKKN